MDKEGLELFDKAIERASRTPVVAGEQRQKKSRTPSWWKGDDAATVSSMMAASQLGVAPQPPGE